jgi:hypothetical protein
VKKKQSMLSEGMEMKRGMEPPVKKKKAKKAKKKYYNG